MIFFVVESFYLNITPFFYGENYRAKLLNKGLEIENCLAIAFSWEGFKIQVAPFCRCKWTVNTGKPWQVDETSWRTIAVLKAELVVKKNMRARGWRPFFFFFCSYMGRGFDEVFPETPKPAFLVKYNPFLVSIAKATLFLPLLVCTCQVGNVHSPATVRVAINWLMNFRWTRVWRFQSVASHHHFNLFLFVLYSTTVFL